MASRASLNERRGSTEPRIWTPPLRELTEETSLGYLAIEFAEEVCGVELLPWQKWLLIHALELAPGLTVDTIKERGPLDPIFRFRRVVVLVARQNGKSTLSQVLFLFSMYVMRTPLVLGTAQDLDTAEEVWDGTLDIIEETPELAALADKPIRINGKKTIRLLTGERYKVKSANRSAGRGLTGDLIVMDELREQQTWDAWAAITKTANARPAAQIWAFSNAGDATSVVLRYLRKRAHADLGDPDGINAADDPSLLLPDDTEATDEEIKLLEEDDSEGSTLGLFEWSAPPDCDVTDPDGMAAANPSMGYLISYAVLLSDAKNDPEWVFRTECLCQWSDGALEGVFPAGTWEEQLDQESAVAPGERIVGCLTVNWERSRSYIAIAGKRTDGRTHIGVVASRSGTDWIKDYLAHPDAPPLRSLVIQERGAPESSLIEELQGSKRADGEPIRILKWGGQDLAAAHGTFYDKVRLGADGPLRHRSQPALEVAVATSVTRPLQDAWVIDLRKSAGDAAPLKATIGAVWGLESSASRVSAYESEDAFDSSEDEEEAYELMVL